MRLRGRESIGVWIAAVVCVLLWERLWDGSRTLYLWDAGTYFHPMKGLLRDAVRAGEWPWWNPWIRNGLPFFANPQVGLFYPPSLLFYLLPMGLAFNWNVILHTALLAAGFAAWLRRGGRSREAAAVGALWIAWGGFALSMTVYLNNLQAMAWIGWTWWAWEGWLGRGGTRWLAATAAGFALVFLAGEPQIAILTGAIALLLAWTRAPDQDGAGRRAWIPVAALAAAALAAMLATAVQLVPTIELFRLSGRADGLSAGESLGASLAPAQLYNLVVPRDFLTAEGLFDFRRIPGVTQPWVFTSYLGVVTVALAAAGFGRARRMLLWAALLAGGVVLALGVHNPLVAAVAEAVPAARVARFPEKMLLLTALAAPVLAAHGFDRLRGDAGALARARVAASLLAVLAGVAWALVASGALDAALAGGAGAGAEGRIDAVASGVRHAFAFALLSAAVLALARRLSFAALGGSLALLGLVDLASANLQVAQVADTEIFARPPAVLEGLPRDTLRTRARIRTSALGEHEGLTFTVPGIASGTNQYYQLMVMGGNLAMLHRVLAQDGAEPFPPRMNDAQDEILGGLPLAHQVRYLRLHSTGWVVERSMEVPGLAVDRPIEELGLVRYRVEDPLPRAYTVGRVEVEPDSIAILNRFVAGGEDPRRVAYVFDEPVLPGPAIRRDDAVRWGDGTNHSVRLEVDARAPAMLVLTDAWYPGWSVRVDGERKPLRRVNWQFRGVVLEAGTHDVRFDYAPRGICAAAAVSVFGVLALALGIALGGRPRAG